jgi:RluA family pseudouridine synthase
MAKQKIQIIHCDDDMLVINKPDGFSTSKDHKDKKDLLVALAEQLNVEATTLLPVHKLDKDTSGVYILARNVETQKKLIECFAKEDTRRTFLALTRGHAPADHGTIEKPIGPAKGVFDKMQIGGSHSKLAVTDWRLLADFSGVSLLAIQPKDDRTHQIRVHLVSCRTPLAIDPLYGGNRPLMLSEFKAGYRLGKKQEEKPLIDRLTLHAYQLQFTLEGKEFSFIAPMEKKFAVTIKMLAKHNPNGPEAFTNPDTLTTLLAGDVIEACQKS